MVYSQINPIVEIKASDDNQDLIHHRKGKLAMKHQSLRKPKARHYFSASVHHYGLIIL